jgi:NADP-dependent 3-hydroxy acid dehydrogenase YdfG
MSFPLKPVGEQTIVLTGASSGIGLATARALADRGAALVLIARNERALDALARECRARGGRALAICADVGRNEDLERVAQLAINTFGGFDTWINNAGVAIYGTCEQVPLADQRRLFDTNYWGVVYGSLIAAKHLRQRGGKIINTGSVLRDRDPARALLGIQACREGLHGCAPDGAGGERRTGVGDTDQAVSN